MTDGRDMVGICRRQTRPVTLALADQQPGLKSRRRSFRAAWRLGLMRPVIQADNPDDEPHFL